MGGARGVRRFGVARIPDFSAGWVIKTGWQNSNNVAVDSIDIQFHCAKISSPAQLFLPEAITQHYRHWPAKLLFFRQKRSSGNGLHTHRFYETSGSVGNPGAHWFASAGDNQRKTTGCDCQGVEALTNSLHVLEVRAGHRHEIPLGADFAQQHQAFTLVIGQRAQQEGVDDGEDCGCRSDTQTEHYQNNRGKARTLQEVSQTVAEILD